MNARIDKMLLVFTALFVGALAFVAGAISFAHMRELALDHDQLGWKSLAFPISVDGLEIVASLYLVAQRRTGRPAGLIPWLTLVVGTAASFAANVAVGGADLIGKALAGWPALSMLVSVKLLFAMFDHGNSGDQRAGVRDDQRTAGTVPDGARTVPDSGRDDRAPSATVSAVRAADPGAPTSGSPGHPGDPAALADERIVADLIPAARAARVTLTERGWSLSRDHLADAMREDGHGVSNERASLLLKILKAERDVTLIGSATVRPHPDGLEPLSEGVA